MQIYTSVVLNGIEREKAGTDYFCVGSDKEILQALLEEINQYAGTNLHYLAELDAFIIPGAGEIVSRYIEQFSSESVRGYLLPQLVANKVKNADRQIMDMYIRFKASDAYLPKPGTPAPAHIYVRYDNAFKSLRSKQIKGDLMKLVYYPRDVFYLPFTTKMLASWRLEEMYDLLVLYASEVNISEQDVGIQNNGEDFFPPFTFIKRELRFTAIDGLKYYPSPKTIEVINRCIDDADAEISRAAKKTLRILKKHDGLKQGFGKTAISSFSEKQL